MTYVLDENGNIKVGPNGKPLIKGSDGKEFEIDAIGAQDKINTIVAESNDRRKKLGEANTKLEAFGDIDPVAAKKALEDVSGMSDKNKTDLDTQRDAINEGWKTKQTEWETEKTTLNDKLFLATTGSKFATSKAVATTVLPPAIALATFGKNFNPDGTANDAAGNVIYSKEKPGEPAGFEESISHLIETYPDKDSILKATAGEGGEGYSSNDGFQSSETKSSGDKIKSGLSKL